MGRELLLGWPGRVLEPVGLAQGGLATDPGGDGMKSGTSQNTSPGFGAFLTFPPPMAACTCVYVWMCMRQRTREGNVWGKQRARMFIRTCVHALRPGCMDCASELKNKAASLQNPSQQEVSWYLSSEWDGKLRRDESADTESLVGTLIKVILEWFWHPQPQSVYLVHSV